MSRNDSSFEQPTETEIAEVAAELGFSLGKSEETDYWKVVSDAVKGSEGVRNTRLFDPGLTPTDYANRNSGLQPSEGENQHNAWLRRTDISRDSFGPLVGVSVGVKDSIALAGIELTLGSSVMEGFVPEIDATVVQRLLDAGADIVGKQNMESFAWSGTGDMSDYGTVTNPYSEDHLAGGSSSGSAVAARVGDCDISLGTDQAGSIRIPSSWCGLVGIKPTHGLVPYTGIVPLERSIDHVGPMGRNVEIVARALETIAGEDTANGIRLDERQPAGIEARDYAAAVSKSPEGLSIAVLEEGFGWDFSESEVDKAVRAATGIFENRGVVVNSVNVPRHRQSVATWGAIATQGGAQLLQQGSVGTNHKGWAWPRLAQKMKSFSETRKSNLPPTVKRSLFTAAYLNASYGVAPYAKARSIAMGVEQDYNEILSEHDALLLPTTCMRAFEKAPEQGMVESLRQEVTTIANTSMFNVTGHPALSVPCAKVDKFPVGMMLVGAHLDETTLITLASAFEDAVDWEKRR